MIDELVRKLARLRMKWESTSDKVRRLEGEFEERMDVREARLAYRKCEAEIADTVDRLREAAVEEYRRTGAKKVHNAVSIRLTIHLQYDPDEVLPWCENHLPLAISYDMRMFERHAKAVAKTAPIPFVEITQEPKATIASDLGEWED